MPGPSSFLHPASEGDICVHVLAFACSVCLFLSFNFSIYPDNGQFTMLFGVFLSASSPSFSCDEYVRFQTHEHIYIVAVLHTYNCDVM